jgi:hypothetical protein
MKRKTAPKTIGFIGFLILLMIISVPAISVPTTASKSPVDLLSIEIPGFYNTGEMSHVKGNTYEVWGDTFEPRSDSKYWNKVDILFIDIWKSYDDDFLKALMSPDGDERETILIDGKRMVIDYAYYSDPIGSDIEVTLKWQYGDLVFCVDTDTVTQSSKEKEIAKEAVIAGAKTILKNL